MLYEMRLVGLAMDPFSNSPIVILKDRNASEEPVLEESEASEGGEAEQKLEQAEEQPADAAKLAGEPEVEERILPIWIGEAEAQSIATVLLGLSVPRPMTHDLLKSVITQMGGNVGRVIVTDLEDNTFYAVIEVSLQNGDTLTIDSRPSDALALALRCEASIFVDAKVLDKTYKSETTSSSISQLSGEEIDEFDQDKWKEMVEKITEQSMKKYKQ